MEHVLLASPLSASRRAHRDGLAGEILGISGPQNLIDLTTTVSLFTGVGNVATPR
jgi:hypothetical protein